MNTRPQSEDSVRIVVGGSIAYDNIMKFPGLFEDCILPDRIHALNVSFLVESLKRIRGGTGPNIAYNLSLVGEQAALLGTAGKDFDEYGEWLQSRGVDTSLTRVLEDDFTASCVIMTDLANNQITSFYPGAMNRDREIDIRLVNTSGVALMIIAPTEPKAMIAWARQCREIGLPYLFDPGMQIPRLNAQELLSGLIGARILVFNEYEYDMMIAKTGLHKQDILTSVELLAITMGERGSVIERRGERVRIPAARPHQIIDPTGSGDAFRAGLLKGYFEGVSLGKMGRYGSVAAVYAVEQKGATEHSYTLEEFNQRYEENFGGFEHGEL